MSRARNVSHGKWPASDRATAMPKVRPSQGSLKVSSPLRRGGAPSPRMSWMKWDSVVADIADSVRRPGGGDRSRGRGLDFLHADHGLRRDEGAELVLGHLLGARRALGQDEVADLGAAVPDAHLHVVADRAAELQQRLPRLVDHAGAVDRVL